MGSVRAGPGCASALGPPGEASSCIRQKRGIAHQSPARRTCQRGRTDWLPRCHQRCVLAAVSNVLSAVQGVVVSVSPHMVQVPLNAGLKHGRMGQH
jgi:hypothetical protein